MSDAVEQDFDAISVLVFLSGGVRFGVESSQVAAIDPYAGSGAEVNIIRLSALLGLSEGFGSGACVTLEIRREGSSNILLLVDKIDDIIVIPLSEIQLLPKVIADRLLQRGIWGAVQQNEAIMILLDLHKMLMDINLTISGETTGSTHIHASQEDTV